MGRITTPILPKTSGPERHHMTDERLLVGMGLYDGITSHLSYGINHAVSTTFEVISGVGQATANLLSPATTLAVSSSSTDDDGSPAGTGAQIVRITGTDANFVEIAENVVMNGTTDVITTGLFCRVNSVVSIATGSGKTNAGDIYVRDDAGDQTSGVPDDLADILKKIKADHSVADGVIFTVPAGKTLFVQLVEIYGGGGKTITYEGKIRLDATDTIISIFEGVIESYQATVRRGTLVTLAEKSTVWIEAKVDTGSTDVAAIIDGWLVDNAKYNI